MWPIGGPPLSRQADAWSSRKLPNARVFARVRLAIWWLAR